MTQVWKVNLRYDEAKTVEMNIAHECVDYTAAYSTAHSDLEKVVVQLHLPYSVHTLWRCGHAPVSLLIGSL